MIGLLALWELSLVLAGLALAIMLGLIVARMLGARRARRTDEQRKKILPILLNASPQGLNGHPEISADLLTDLSLELMQLLRGEEREALVSDVMRSGVDRVLRKRLKSRIARRRVLAAEALREFRDSFSTDALEGALDDRHPEVRLVAAMSLAASGRAPPTQILIKKLGIGGAEQSMLISGLFHHIARERPEEIQKLVDDANHSLAVKAAAIEALAKTGDYSIVESITALALSAPDDSPELPRLLRALGILHHPAGASAVQRGLSNPNWWVRAAAAEAAGRIEMIEVCYRLLAMLEDDDWWVRFRAGEALGRMGEPGHRLLGEVRRCGKPRSREAARLTLAEIGVPA